MPLWVCGFYTVPQAASAVLVPYVTCPILAYCCATIDHYFCCSQPLHCTPPFKHFSTFNFYYLRRYLGPTKTELELISTSRSNHSNRFCSLTSPAIYCCGLRPYCSRHELALGPEPYPTHAGLLSTFMSISSCCMETYELHLISPHLRHTQFGHVITTIFISTRPHN